MKNRFFRNRYMLHNVSIWMLLLMLQSMTSVGQGACDTMKRCTCHVGDLSPSGVMIGHNHPKGTWMFSYRFMTMNMKNNLSGTSIISDQTLFTNYLMAPQKMHMDMHMIMAMYGITDRFSVMAMFNYSFISMNMEMMPGTAHMNMPGMSGSDINSTHMKSTSSGISDTKIYATYTLLNKSNHKLLLSTGLNIPTGNINVKGGSKDMMYIGQRLPYMMQLGSGTFDLMPGVTYILNKKNSTFGTQATGVVRANNNSVGYCYGNELTINTWFAYRFLKCASVSVRAEGYSSGSISGRDPLLYEILEPAAKPTNYGGQRASTYLGFNVYLNHGSVNNKLSIECGRPLYQNLYGQQMAQQSMLYAGWLMSFK